MLHNYEEQVQELEKQKKQADEKYGLKDLINNPWKLSNLLIEYRCMAGGVSQASVRRQYFNR